MEIENLDYQIIRLLDLVHTCDNSIKLEDITVDATPNGNWAIYDKGKRICSIKGSLLSDDIITKYNLENHNDDSIITEADDEKKHPEVEEMLKQNIHPVSKLPMYPDSEEGQESYESLIGNKRFKDIIENLKRFTGFKNTINSVMDVYPLLVKAYSKSINIEVNHKEELENLAVKLVTDYFKIPESTIDFQVKLVNHGDINLDNIPNEEDELEEELEDMTDIDLEISKRKFLNSMIQGAAVKTTHSYWLVKEELKKINPDLLNTYGILSYFSEYGYWMTPDKIASASKNEAAVGKVEVDISKEIPIIKASATSFPFLIHEITKGVMEVLSQHGLPQDEKKRKYIISKSDFLDAEHWNLRLGPGMWEHFVEMVGKTNENDIIPNLYATIAAMPVRDFNIFVKEILKRSPEGEKMLKDLAVKIREDIKNDKLGNNDESDITPQVNKNVIPTIKSKEEIQKMLKDPNLSNSDVNKLLDMLDQF